MENSFIKLYRNLLEWEWFKNSEMVHLFTYLLLKANFTDGKFQGKEIKRGQLITGRNSLSENTGISQQKIRTCLERLQLTNEITIHSTNKYSIITIVKYDFYQCFETKSTNKPTNKLTIKQPTTNHQLTTIEESNKKKNILIPSIEEFLEHAKTIKEFNYSEYEFSLKSKYQAWVDRGWKDGNGSEIKNWKSKINNTYPYLKPIKQINNGGKLPSSFGYA